jgi:hypothetical protein
VITTSTHQEDTMSAISPGYRPTHLTAPTTQPPAEMGTTAFRYVLAAIRLSLG